MIVDPERAWMAPPSERGFVRQCYRGGRFSRQGGEAGGHVLQNIHVAGIQYDRGCTHGTAAGT